MPSTGITLEQKVQPLLQLDELCVKCACGDLIKGKERIGCLVSLVSRLGDNALLVYQNPSQAGLGSPLNLLYALAIRGPFSVSGDADLNQSSGLMVRFQILADDRVKYVFEIENSEQSMRFVTQLKTVINDYRQKAHVIGVPEFKWLEGYKQQIVRKSIDVPEDWAWNHILNQIPEPTTPTTSSAASTIQETKATDLFSSDDATLDVFGMPGFTPNDSIIHPSPSTSSLTKLDVTDRPRSSASPSFPRKVPSNLTAREGFVKLHMETREAEYIDMNEFKFFIGTWNVNGRNPGNENLTSWLRCDEEPSDVVIVGFQELDLSAEALLLSNVTSSSSRPKEEDWQKAVEKTLCSKVDYSKVRSIRLVGMYLLVYAKSEHMPYIRNVEAEDVGTGIMGMMGNKGGVSIRMELHNTSLCFVNSHLAAHQEEYERRNQDYRDILSKLKFSNIGDLAITDHEIVFWLGDLNFRVNDVDVEQSKILIKKGRLDKLLEKDQLLIQKEMQKCFVGFKEGPITFKPTYKYDPGTDNWDSSEKGRAPAWCDRILFRGNNVKLIAYRSHPSLRISDHKPVSSLFGVGIKVVDREKERQVYEDVARMLDKHENENLPQVKLSTTEVKFKDVQFLEKSSLMLEIENIGQTSVQFSFIGKLDDKEYCKPWLTVKPHVGIILPGHTKEVKLTVYVDKETAGALNSGDDKMDDILVLHLEGGKDFFIVVTGNYVPSVFGSSLDALVHMYGPIRDVPVANLVDLEHNQSDRKPKSSLARSKEPLEIPKELWLLVDQLFKCGYNKENIFKQSGFEQEIQQIRTHLDTGKTGKIPGSIHSIAEALLIFLEALPVPVIPFGFYNKALDCCNNYVLCKQLVYQIPDCHRNVFTYITAFLRELLRSATDNKLDAKTLATLFGALFLRTPKDVASTLNKRTVAQHTNKKARFVYHFILNEFDVR